MKTPEDRAQEIVTVTDGGLLLVGSRVVSDGCLEVVQERAAVLRRAVAEAIRVACAEAVHDHLASVSPEGPVNEERLKECLDGLWDNPKPGQAPLHAVVHEMRDMARAMLHLRSLCARLLNDDPIGQFQAGLEQGRREGRKAAADDVREWCETALTAASPGQKDAVRKSACVAENGRKEAAP